LLLKRRAPVLGGKLYINFIQS